MRQEIKKENKEQQKVWFFFVYGTLQQGFRLRTHFPGLYDICPMELEKYDLYSLGQYPYIVPNKRSKKPVQGTLCFTRDPEIKKQLDKVELGAGYEIVKKEIYLPFNARGILVYNYQHKGQHILNLREYPFDETGQFITVEFYVMNAEKHESYKEQKRTERLDHKNFIKHVAERYKNNKR